MDEVRRHNGSINWPPSFRSTGRLPSRLPRIRISSTSSDSETGSSLTSSNETVPAVFANGTRRIQVRPGEGTRNSTSTDCQSAPVFAALLPCPPTGVSISKRGDPAAPSDFTRAEARHSEPGRRNTSWLRAKFTGLPADNLKDRASASTVTGGCLAGADGFQPSGRSWADKRNNNAVDSIVLLFRKPRIKFVGLIQLSLRFAIRAELTQREREVIVRHRVIGFQHSRLLEC